MKLYATLFTCALALSLMATPSWAQSFEHASNKPTTVSKPKPAKTPTPTFQDMYPPTAANVEASHVPAASTQVVASGSETSAASHSGSLSDATLALKLDQMKKTLDAMNLTVTTLHNSVAACSN